MRSPKFLFAFLDDFEGNTNISVTIESASTVTAERRGDDGNIHPGI